MQFETIRLIQYPYDSPFQENGAFTDSTKEVFFKTLELSLRFSILGQVPATVVLWSLLRTREKVGLAALKACGVRIELLETNIVQEISPLFGSKAEHEVNFQSVFELAQVACNEAALLGNNFVGTEHLTLALLQSEDESLRRIFQKYAVTYDLFKSNLIRLKNS
jgi:ATP-dependent Clp protease ATP-binding subunit ClpA